MERPKKAGRIDKIRAVLAVLTLFSSSLFIGNTAESSGIEKPVYAAGIAPHVGSVAISNFYQVENNQQKEVHEYISEANLAKEVKEQAIAHAHYLAHWAASMVTPLEFKQWSLVNKCEEGGNWHVSGSKFSGGLGISDKNWGDYGGTQFTPTAATATPDEQIVIAMRIQSNPPDQVVCAPW